MPDHLAAKGVETGPTCPIDQALPALLRKLDDWHQDFGTPFLIALSGGGDSMALCHFASQWAKARNGAVHAVSIDHGLRPSSAADAAQAIQWAKALGLTGEVIRLDERPATGGLQEWARHARYEALAKVAARLGAKVILVGHTWDDQVETLCWRLARQTGLDGLAGMAELAINPGAAPEAPNLLGRPLLGLKRADLRLWLRRKGQDWLEDESNQNLDFARIRTRKLVRAMAAQGVNLDRIIRLAATADALRTLQEQASRALLARCNLSNSAAGWQLEAAGFWDAEAVIAERALGWLIYSLTPVDRPPEADKLKRLWSALAANPQRARTLGGVLFVQRGAYLHAKLAPVRRDQSPAKGPSSQGLWARLFAVSRQPHEFVTQLNWIRAEDGLTSLD